MPNSRKTRWDWTPHIRRMVELHRAGKSIPQIRKAIVSDDFKPCERSVYNRFRHEGLSTGHDRKQSHLQNGCDAETENCGVLVRNTASPASLLDETPSEAGRFIHDEDSIEVLAPLAQDSNCTTAPSSYTAQDGVCGPEWDRQGAVGASNDTLSGPSFLKETRLDGSNIADDDMTSLAADSRPPMPTSQSPRPFMLEESGTVQSYKRKKRSKMSPEVNDQIIKNLQDAGLLSRTQHGGGRTRHPDRTKNSSAPLVSRSKTLMGKLRPWLNRSSCSQKSRASQDSPFPDNDSGYASGRGTPSTLPLRPSLASDSMSIVEFRGLYKVTCHSIHDSEYSYNNTEPKSCQVCGYSAIHHLAYAAKHLTVAELELALGSSDIYQPQALDAAGNSALHYAAISGASSAHLKAFINAGVPLHVQNTAKQNFLHCLRPCEAENDSCEVDCFDLGLVELLEIADTEKILGQQDNDGQTVLHMLAVHIIEPELRDHTFKFFSKRGLSAGVVNRFGKSAKDLCAAGYKFDQTMFAADTFSRIKSQSQDFEIPEGSDWERSQLRQMSDQDIIWMSHNNPRYMDSKTKDTVFHALSRVNTQSQGNMQDLRQSIAKGVNLNRHNCDGHHPLAAFICNQRFRGSETGATLAKYIDILLWKDKKCGELNDINVDMMTADGTTALYEAAVRAQPDTVRSLIEAGANVNARLNNDPLGLSVLRATHNARNAAVMEEDDVRKHIFKEVISHLEHARAAEYPSSLQARGCAR